MSVNGITSVNNAASAYSSKQTPSKATAADTTATTTAAASTAEESGVVYEPSKETATNKNKIYTPNNELISKLKADADARTEQMRNLVEQLMCKQGDKAGIADNMYRFLASGNYKVDAATQAAAKADIAEDGYYGVAQTSDRIIEFAKALSGGDPAQMDKMVSAFKKGFQQATKTWGQKLPDICQKTYDAVLKKFEDLKNETI